jgi:hypothetical protein
MPEEWQGRSGMQDPESVHLLEYSTAMMPVMLVQVFLTTEEWQGRTKMLDPELVILRLHSTSRESGLYGQVSASMVELPGHVTWQDRALACRMEYSTLQLERFAMVSWALMHRLGLVQDQLFVGCCERLPASLALERRLEMVHPLVLMKILEAHQRVPRVVSMNSIDC